MLTPPLKRAAIFLALALGLGLAGACSAKSNNEVATIDKEGPAPVKELTAQRKTAEALSNCLAEAGVVTYLEDYGEGDAFVRFNTDYPYAFSPVGNFAEIISGKLSEAEAIDYEATVSKLIEPHDQAGTGWLIWGEVDLTDHYMGCLDSSGYFEPEPTIDVAEELKFAADQTAANAKWAQCARENGFPSLADPPTPSQQEVLDHSWQRNLYIPGRVSPDQLRALLTACPLHDLVAAEKCGKASTNWDWDAKPDGPKECEFVAEPSVFLDEAAFGLEEGWREAEPNSDRALEYQAARDVLREIEDRAYQLRNPEQQG